MTDLEPKTTAAPPQELQEHRRMSKYDKAKTTEKGFFEQEFIKSYLEDKWKDELFNRDNFIFVYELHSKETNPEKMSECQAVLREFQNAIINQVDTYKALYIDFKKYPFKGSQLADGEVSGWDD